MERGGLFNRKCFECSDHYSSELVDCPGGEQKPRERLHKPRRLKVGEAGWVKINVDAANNAHTGNWAWGWIGSDSSKCFLRARSRVAKAVWDPVEAGAIGVREAILWAREVGWDKIVVETDAALVLPSIQGDACDAQ
ncbi:unnamed protein product [Cuscuta epithymum]|uniref:RNase H type-1 domain-containing protein n=1 Tax=Cuscuta epithymum TaxID=186058 RepID=A0AAV0FAR3_9ASTE|nr:unnamed protein product [Cuscuta epithymum]